MATYYIGASSDDFWHETNAKTLRGAKRLAMMHYQQSVGGRIMVGEKYGADDQARIERIAIRHGFDKWQQY